MAQAQLAATWDRVCFKVGHQVAMFDRQEVADAINTNGITVKEGDQIDHVEPTAVLVTHPGLGGS